MGSRFYNFAKLSRRALRYALGALTLSVTPTPYPASCDSPPVTQRFYFPTVPAAHLHARKLLENSLRYLAPEHNLVHPDSGYPVEGWNQDPQRGLVLRSFTQLTAIGKWMELLANVAAGRADSPFLSRDQALAQLMRLVKSLRADQRNPRLADKGLLVNFLDLEGNERRGPLASEVEKKEVIEAFGSEKGEALWKALLAQGWIVEQGQGRTGVIKRGERYGAAYFHGALQPFSDEATVERLLNLLDRRVVMIVFGDNANLSASAAKTIGSLLDSTIRDRAGAGEVRKDLEAFLADQAAGYNELFDKEAGLFYFGREATRNRMYGWDDSGGRWIIGYTDYLASEFRAAATFVALRFGIPVDAIAHLGFKAKPYDLRNGGTRYVLAPWEGSAFQALGLSLFFGELETPSWRTLLRNVVDVEVDYSQRNDLPGFLTESYTGNGTEYSGRVGVPEIAVTLDPRITDAPSLYSLGTAYTVAPEEIEAFLRSQWQVIETLLTEHGPWEGYNTSTREIIRFQTTAHTLSLILGLLNTGWKDMQAYLTSRQLMAPLAEFYRAGEKVDLLSDSTTLFAWCDGGGAVQFIRNSSPSSPARIQSSGGCRPRVAFQGTGGKDLNLSGLKLRVRYRASARIADMFFELKSAADLAPGSRLISKQILLRPSATPNTETTVEIPLPAYPGLRHIKEVLLFLTPAVPQEGIDLSISSLEGMPL